MRCFAPDTVTVEQYRYSGAHDFDAREFIRDLNRTLMNMCEASGFSRWPHEMGDVPMWVIAQYMEHRDRRARETRKMNKGAMIPIIPDWLL
jgi:hypothetical protein